MDYLLCKIIHVNFPSLVVKFDLPLKHKDSNFPSNIYHKYIDKLEDWRNNMDIIFFIASYRMKNRDNLEFYKEALTNSVAYNYYLNLEKKIIKFIKSLNPKKNLFAL